MTDLLTIIMGQSGPFSGVWEAIYPLSFVPPLLISTPPSSFLLLLHGPHVSPHLSHFWILDHPLSVLLLRYFATSSHPNHDVVWTR